MAARPLRRQRQDRTLLKADPAGDACDAQIGPPPTKDACKNGGWKDFNFPRKFKNQGDCVSYTNTGK